MTTGFTDKERGLFNRLDLRDVEARDRQVASVAEPMGSGVFSQEIRDAFGQSAGSFGDFEAMLEVLNVKRLIARAARKWNVDPLGVIGAIVWEAFVNPRWTLLRGSGFGKMHYREWWILFEGEPLAKQLEDVGYLTPLTMEQRRWELVKPDVAVTYITVAMHAFSVLAEKYGHSIRNRPEILCTAYNRFKLDTWDEHLAEKPKGEPLRPGDMGEWVENNLGLLRKIYPDRTWYLIDVDQMEPQIRLIDQKLASMVW